MEMSKKEKIFRNIVCNLVVCCLVLTVLFACIIAGKEKVETVATNKEYNGTIYAGDKSTNTVSLMINVYWGNEHLERILSIFENNGINSTFFIGGSWALENQELLKKIKDLGHEIASHGFSHKEHGKLDYNNNLIEIQKCHNIVKDILGVDMELFAPPGGSYNKQTIKAAEDLGYKTIMWTRDTIDWRDKDADLIYKRAVNGLSGGDLILMHPTNETVVAIEKFIELAKSKNLKISTVSQTLGL